MGRDQSIRLSERVGAVTGPWVLPRMGDEPRPYRIHLDVTVAGEQVSLAVNQRCSIASFPQRPGSTVTVVEIAHVAPADRLHGSRDASCRPGSHQQMHMIRHQDIRVNGAAIATAGIGEALSKDEIILVPREDRTAIVPALNYVQRLFRHEKSWSTWHSNLPRANEQSRDN
jgi:hypothetical protein